MREDQRTRDYMMTEVQPLTDEQARHDFVIFGPYAYDATLWAEGYSLASLADEGTSFVVSLTDEDRNALEHDVGLGRVVTLHDWRERHPSMLRRLFRGFQHR